MPGKRKTRAASVHAGDEEFGPTTRPVRKAKASNSKLRLEENLEYEDDPGRDSSRVFQQAGMVDEKLKAENNKSKKFLDQYRKSTIGKRNQLLDLMTKNEKELAFVDDELVATLRSVCADLPKMLGEDKDNQFPITRRSHSLFKATEEILSISHEILGRHAKAEKECSSHKPVSIPDQWGEDEKSIREMFHCGREYGEALAESIVIPGNEASVMEVDKKCLTVNEDVAVDLFRSSRKKVERSTWGQIAWAQMRALEGVIATIPNSRKG